MHSQPQGVALLPSARCDLLVFHFVPPVLLFLALQQHVMSSPQFVHIARPGKAWQFQQRMIPTSRQDLSVTSDGSMLYLPLALVLSR